MTALLSTVAGKVAAGVVVASASVGAAAAAGTPVPFTAPSEDRPPVEVVEEPAVEEQTVEEPAVEEPAGDDGVDGETEDPNHGEVVSQFATTTELEGCVRGQAVAAVARGDVEPGPDGTIDEAAVEAFVTESGKCADETELEDEAGDEESQAAAADERGKPNRAERSNGGGRPDHAGPPAGRGPNG
ncbi:MAG: hypothetical protein ACLGHQ_01560 [Acidimicrobiia bacterium]